MTPDTQRFVDCPCDRDLVGLLRRYPPVIANGMVCYPPQMPVCAVMSVRQLETLCFWCRSEAGL